MERNAASGTDERVRGLADEALSRMGYELVDLQYRREPSGWTVRLFIDKPGGVGLEDCRRVSEEFGTILEVEDPIPHRYVLEVSSPGLDRPLRKAAHFAAAVGRRVKLLTKRPIDGRRHYAGSLVRITPRGEDDHDLLLLDDTGVEHAIAIAEVERAHVVHEWPEPVKPGHGRPGREVQAAGGSVGSKRRGKDR